MPKIVDHEQRRRELAEALWRVADSRGIDAISLRTVAAEAGWSTGSLRHYFATREELLEFALESSSEWVRQRIQNLACSLSSDLPMIERFATLIDELLPLDRRRRTEFLIWQAFGQQSHDAPALARRLWAAQRDLYRTMLTAWGDRPPPESPGEPGDAWAETWAEYLHVVVDGLAAQMIGAPTEMPPERARALLRRFLTDIPVPPAPAES
jgi:AcrR family transcriptional regulator